ncbi:PEP-CTERM sorting domain-containing protein [Bremerella cremea]|nr:PEP-CTERM sorting domain-containing protein [Bremerella cremea]
MRRTFALTTTVVAALLALTIAPCCEAGILTGNESGNTPTGSNSFNYDGTSYDFIAKFDNGQPFPFADFTFYTLDPTGSTSYTWNQDGDWGTHTFSEVEFIPGTTNPQDILDSILGQEIAGFEYHGTTNIDYYLVKASNEYSVWEYQPGFNQLFLDDDGQPGGAPWVSGKTQGISHISFYGNPAVSSVPEPGSLALFGLGALGMGAIARRRLKKQAAA